jgi:hypothetical protein
LPEDSPNRFGSKHKRHEGVFLERLTGEVTSIRHGDFEGEDKE